MRTRGAVTFTDDHRDVEALSDTAYFLVREIRDGIAREYEVEPTAAGGLRRTFYLHHEPHALDEAARAWIDDILPYVLRTTGLDATNTFDSDTYRQRVLARAQPTTPSESDASVRLTIKKNRLLFPPDVHVLIEGIGYLHGDSRDRSLTFASGGLLTVNGRRLTAATYTVRPDDVIEIRHPDHVALWTLRLTTQWPDGPYRRGRRLDSARNTRGRMQFDFDAGLPAVYELVYRADGTGTIEGWVRPSVDGGIKVIQAGPGQGPNAALRVWGVLEGSAAAQAGVQPGDLITHLDEQAPVTPAAYYEHLHRKQPGESLRLGVLRRGEPLTVTFPLQAVTR